MAHHGARGIPLVVIRRLPIYQRYLDELNRMNIDRIASPELAARIGITASQLRQDLSWFGSFGLQGYGYHVPELLKAINHIIGLDQKTLMVLVGYGNLGRAIAGYEGFQRRNFILTAAFDKDPAKWGPTEQGITVYDLNHLSDYVKNHQIQIGILAIPSATAQATAELLVNAGIKGIWNFSPVRLQVPANVIVEHLHLTNSLMTLSLKIHQNAANLSEEEQS
jgi:redox-sensing transcriptional repressor